MLSLVGYAEGFLKINGIDGESKATGYDGWIDIQSFSIGLGSSVSDFKGSTRTISEASPETLKVEKILDVASPYLFLASAQQKLFSSVVLEYSSPQSQKDNASVRYEFSNVGVSSLDTFTDTSQKNSESLIRETVEFDFEDWAMHYQSPGLVEISSNWNFVDGTGEVLVTDAPEVPQIEPFDALVADPGADYSINVNLSDKDTPVEQLSLRAESLDPEKVTIVGFEGDGAKRTLKVLLSEFFSGSASVQVWISDGIQSSSRTLLLTIEGGSTPYETFLLAAFGEELTENDNLGLPIGDPDNDGLRTITEFYLGTDPNLFTASNDAIHVERRIENGEVKTQLHFFRRTDMSGLTGRIQLSSNLKDWTDLGLTSDPALVETVSPTDGPYEEVTATISQSLDEWEKSFLRIQVEGAF